LVCDPAGKGGDEDMRKTLLAAAVAAGSMALAGPANAADYIINFSTNQILFGAAQSGSATVTTSNTLTTSPLGMMGYAITGITGMLNGSAITGLSGFQGSDNFYYTSGSFVDGSGLGFTTAGGTSASLYFASVAQKYQLTTTSPFSSGYVTATSRLATPAVPEPAAWAMLMLGFGGIGFALRRRKAVTVSFA
jgi:hypothetical protein